MSCSRGTSFGSGQLREFLPQGQGLLGATQAVENPVTWPVVEKSTTLQVVCDSWQVRVLGALEHCVARTGQAAIALPCRGK